MTDSDTPRGRRLLDSFLSLAENQQKAVMFSMLYEVMCQLSRDGRKDIDEVILFMAGGGTLEEWDERKSGS